jgi:hypothetical protein
MLPRFLSCEPDDISSLNRQEGDNDQSVERASTCKSHRNSIQSFELIAPDGIAMALDGDLPPLEKARLRKGLLLGNNSARSRQ